MPFVNTVRLWLFAAATKGDRFNFNSYNLFFSTPHQAIPVCTNGSGSTRVHYPLLNRIRKDERKRPSIPESLPWLVLIAAVLNLHTVQCFFFRSSFLKLWHTIVRFLAWNLVCYIQSLFRLTFTPTLQNFIDHFLLHQLQCNLIFLATVQCGREGTESLGQTECSFVMTLQALPCISCQSSVSDQNVLLLFS